MINDRRELIAAIRQKISPTEMRAALVFNCHITGLAVARSLGSRGVPVIGLDQDETGYGLHSRYTTVAGRCPYPLDDERGFIDLLLEIGAALKQKAVLFPCLDEWVFAIARHAGELGEYFILPFSDIETVERILDKNLLYRKCEERGIPIPRTFYVGEQSAEHIASEISFPCIVKPALQREFTNEFGEKVLRAESREDFLGLCERAGHHSLLAQEIVGAGIDSFYSLCSYIGRDGHAKGVFVGRKLEQYPPDFGTACLVDSHYVEEIVERGCDILEQFGYHGISEVEFIYDEKSRDFKLLDINTRVWKWIGLPIQSGIDLPWLAYADAVHGNVEAAGRQSDGLRWVYLKDYVALRRARSGSDETTLTRKDWVDLITGQAAASGEIVDAVLSSDDPEPFVQMIESLFTKRQYYCAC
ncbi:MAG TPA: carboxylate--amine ligase [Blastocatellia bacterium]|nr:carboxylate--amine ligase [Blastocatellia bacterium]